MSAPYQLKTPGQLRSFRLLTLAQMVHGEAIGLFTIAPTARKLALEALGIPNTDEARRTPANAVIEQLRRAAADAIGVIDAEPPTRAIPPRPTPALDWLVVAAERTAAHYRAQRGGL